MFCDHSHNCMIPSMSSCALRVPWKIGQKIGWMTATKGNRLAFSISREEGEEEPKEEE